MKCRLCRRESEVGSDLCRRHERARVALEEGYKAWKYAYDDLSWTEYLDKIIKNGETGEWVLDVARLVLSKDG